MYPGFRSSPFKEYGHNVLTPKPSLQSPRGPPSRLFSPRVVEPSVEDYGLYSKRYTPKDNSRSINRSRLSQESMLSYQDDVSIERRVQKCRAIQKENRE